MIDPQEIAFRRLFSAACEKCFGYALTSALSETDARALSILLAEDPTFSNRVLRLSFSYNDFFGGYSKEPEIIIQGLSSVASSQFSKPEEFAHIPILTLDNGTDSLVWNNLRNAALKIEKKGQSFRFLFSTGAAEVFAFKEAVHGEFEFQPTYVGLFAMQGRASETHIAPIFVDLFTVTGMTCDE
ncbi:MAG TPA: hypothetical protein VK658_01880 [Chryseolinea sp.]|nr:hypothetical protein [Chryseolinea sp.]